MTSFQRTLFAVVASVAVLSPALAQMKPDDQIKYRKATFNFAAMNMARVKANLDGNFDAASAKVAANAVATAFQTRPETLFGEGTDKSSSFKVEAKPEIWLDKEKFDRLMDNARKTTDALVVAVQSGDKGKVGAAFAEVGKSCKACHDDFRSR